MHLESEQDPEARTSEFNQYFNDHLDDLDALLPIWMGSRLKLQGAEQLRFGMNDEVYESLRQLVRSAPGRIGSWLKRLPLEGKRHRLRTDALR
jgi:hypothetical protein